ncbi:nuclear transport factor 2 family protein [Saccharomonospora cyanea]|uniref:SnoaL-like polyketide cyclase n=1 Tax=Saccharomonospora cyanea NA-134 TaxID=882082 RepID=H5XIP5_9PSEU|nr:nuclear transport factor 2 family protein [Saccharomonospora cyanea]EHR59647.1 SnoaL-like polyketide cyclase [Saccharomonospora cyanea NA-134]
MRPLTDIGPKQFIADFFTSFTEELLRSDEDPALIFDRYHTPDVVQVADGHRMDRDKLIAHTRPVRKNRPSSRMDVHEAVASGDRIAARYTLHVRQRGKDLAIEVCFFGRFATDGRMREAHMLTRTVPATAGAGPKPVSGAPEGKDTSS